MQDIRKLMRQAQEMQAQMQRVQEQLGEQEVEGTSGGGKVVVTMNGRHEVRRVRIDPKVVDPEDVEMLEDLIAAAMNDADAKIQTRMKEEMSKLTGGLGIPGLF
ncbi:MAG: YbaB/EbfC family nucleoid-associated protein [Candidatus Eisenbacteria bacterium]|nr:YbaB/EbfC family nucleoid-associated protein [Candidatus Eisenbacteria bacterium]